MQAQWMIYWIVFSLFLSLERFFDNFVVWYVDQINLICTNKYESKK